jgi:hypothetical protein
MQQKLEQNDEKGIKTEIFARLQPLSETSLIQ